MFFRIRFGVNLSNIIDVIGLIRKEYFMGYGNYLKSCLRYSVLFNDVLWEL